MSSTPQPAIDLSFRSYAEIGAPNRHDFVQLVLPVHGQLVLEIDGDGAALRDHLIITGNASFTGGRIVLDFGDYTGSGELVLGDVLQVGGRLSLAHPLTGQAAQIKVIGLAPGLGAQVAWQGQSLGITVTSAVPEPATWALWLAGLAGAAMLRRHRMG